jgi:hypothetical protein
MRPHQSIERGSRNAQCARCVVQAVVMTQQRTFNRLTLDIDHPRSIGRPRKFASGVCDT